MPEFTELLTPAGLGALSVVIVGLLKRVEPPNKGPDWLRNLASRVGRFARQRSWLTSVIVSGVLAGVLGLIVRYGLGDEAAWMYGLLSWFVGQGIYNTQKAATK